MKNQNDGCPESPNLSKMAGDDKMLEWHIIQSLLAEVTVLIGEDNAVDFHFANSQKGRVILVPQSLVLVASLKMHGKNAGLINWLNTSQGQHHVIRMMQMSG